jgi:hypothetical protein
MEKAGDVPSKSFIFYDTLQKKYLPFGATQIQREPRQRLPPAKSCIFPDLREGAAIAVTIY